MPNGHAPALKNVVQMKPRLVTEAPVAEMLATLRDLRDWMDNPEFADCPIPTPLASRIRLAVVKAERRR